MLVFVLNWGTTRHTTATTAVYNLMNSAAALLGSYATWDQISSSLPVWLAAFAAGGTVGAVLGSRNLSDR